MLRAYFFIFEQILSMRNWLLGVCSVGILTMSCQQEEEKDTISEDISIGQEWVAHLVTGSDSYQTERIGDTTIYIFSDMRVSVVEKYDEPGEYIQITSGKKNFVIDEEAAYFLGKVGQYLLIDAGTSTVRNISIIRSEDQEKIHTGISYRDVYVELQKVYYKTKIELAEEDNKPECSSELKSLGTEEQLGYLQTVYFDLDSLQLQQTNQIECAYFE